MQCKQMQKNNAMPRQKNRETLSPRGKWLLSPVATMQNAIQKDAKGNAKICKIQCKNAKKMQNTSQNAMQKMQRQTNAKQSAGACCCA